MKFGSIMDQLRGSVEQWSINGSVDQELVR